MRASRLLAAGGALVLVVGVVALSSPVLAKDHPQRTKPHGAKSGTALAFSRMVVVDMQRPGFEPDVKVGPDEPVA